MPKALNATAASLLGFLHKGPMAGWDLVETAQRSIGGFWSLTRSQVYRELASMEADGLIARGDTGPRDRKPYTITDSGRQAFAEWIARDPGEENIRYPLLLTVLFGEHLAPGELDRMLAAHRAVHRKRLDDYLSQEQAPDFRGNPCESATLDFGIRYERAVLDWFDNLPARLTRHT